MAAGPGGKEVGRVSIRVVPDVSGFREKLRAELAALEKELAQEISVDVDLDTAKARASMNALMAKLKAEGQRGVTIETNIDKDRLSGFLSGIGSGAAGAGSSMQGFGRNLAIVAAVAALAAPALALVSGLLVSLPAVIASVLVPIAAIALGLDGIKEAAKVMGPAFEDLKKTMSTRFQDVFTPIFQKLNNVFPTLKESLPQVANALGDVASSFVDVVTSNAGLEAIRGTIRNIADTISASAPGVGKLTSGLLNLTDKVSAKFPAIGKYIDDVGTSFDNWVSKVSTADSSGTSPLDRAMGNLGKTLKGLLDIIGDLASAGFEFLQDPKFGKAMTDFVTSAQQLISDILPGLKQFFIDIAGGVKQVTDGIQLLKTFDPETGKVDTDKLKQIGQDDLFAPFTSADAPWRSYFEDLKTAWAAVTSFVSTTWDQLVGDMSMRWTAISTAGSQVWTTIQTAATTAWQFITTTWAGVASMFSTWWSSISAGASSTFSAISGFFTGIPGALSAAWAGLAGIASSAWNAVTSAVSAAINTMKTTVSEGISSVVTFFQELPGKIVAALGDLAGQLASAASHAASSFIDSLASGISAGIDRVKGAVSSVMAGIANFIPHSPAKEGPLSGSGWVDGSGEAIIGTITDGIKNGSAELYSTLKQVFQAIKDVFGDSANLGLNFNIGGTGSSSLPAQLGQLTPALKDFQSTVSNGIAPAKLDDQTKAQIDQIKQQQKLLEIQAKQATIDSKGAASDEEKKKLQDLAAQYRLQKDQLGLQADQLSYAQKYGGEIEGANAAYDGLGKKIGEAGSGFLEANANQAMQDLGIGGGAITAAIDQGIGLAKQYVFNVGSMDDALAGQRNLVNKDALQFTQR